MTPTPHLQAASMRAAAADHCRKVSEDCKKYNLPQAAGMVASVGREILALPLEADHKALLAEAVKLPEIARLIRDARWAEKSLRTVPMDESNTAQLLSFIKSITALDTP